MAIDKTLTDKYRRNLTIDYPSVLEVLPGHYGDKYPNLVKFLEEYYKSLEEEGNPAEKLNDLLFSRDVTGASVELLTFISNELLLGKPYFESFNDKRTSLQFSNLLYRSKGTEFSISQFFRIFYGLDVEVRYGKDEVFFIGDPSKEEMIFAGEGSSGSTTYPYTFRGSVVTVSVSDSDGVYRILQQDRDYKLNFSTQTIELQSFDSVGLSLDSSDSLLSFLATEGKIATGSNIKIVGDRRTQTTIGSDVTNKRITNDKFYQLYSLLISTPIGVSTWRDAYKTFIHPAGMFLAGQVSIVSEFDFNLGAQPTFVEPPEPIRLVSVATIQKRNGIGLHTTSISEIAEDSDGDFVRTRVNDLQSPFRVAGWHTQYGSLARADDIEARTLDDTYADLSNIINTLDENRWSGLSPSGGESPWIMATGSWNDDGIWADTEIWQDGELPWALATGSWNDSGVWIDSEPWNDS